jgi:predicted amidohydrolase YtcJ
MFDSILFNARVLTLDRKYPLANCIAIRNGKIQMVTAKEHFSKDEVASREYLDCGGRTVVPGFIDAHCHLFALAESLVTLNLAHSNQIKSIQDIKDLIRQSAEGLKPGEWIRGSGYDEFSLIERRCPNRWDLDEVAPANPVKLTHRSGHAHLLNSLALKKVGISNETSDPPGGIIERDLPSGEPCGLLFGMNDFLKNRIPPMETERLEVGMKKANQILLSLGITSVQDASPSNNLERFERMHIWKEAQIVKPRITLMLGWEEFNNPNFSRGVFPVQEESLRLGPVKIMVKETTGQLHPSQSKLKEMIQRIHRSGLQAALHVMEIRSIEAAFAAIEETLRIFPKSDHRHRLEHCSLCTTEMAKRLADLGVTVVTMPAFLYYHGSRYLRTIPFEEIPFLYPLGTLKKHGVPLAAGSDSPMTPIDPFIGIYAAAFRKTETGEVVCEEERINTLEALKLYTIQAAHASFEETIKGSISPGKMADLVVLNEDPTLLPSERIKDLQVEMTILGGEVVWERNPKR